MTAVARGILSGDAVSVPSHGNPCPLCACLTASVITTDTRSEDVLVNVNSGGDGIVRKDDLHVIHASPGCRPHQTPLDVYSLNVFANGREVGRIQDVYDNASGMSHIIIGGSPNVYANGLNQGSGS
jgi:hypothetical protein